MSNRPRRLVEEDLVLLKKFIAPPARRYGGEPA
jgi:hypothetical protein